MFSLVCPASCVTPSEGLNCSESIDIVKMIESNTVIGFWENLIEDVKKYFFFILIYEAWIWFISLRYSLMVHGHEAHQSKDTLVVSDQLIWFLRGLKYGVEPGNQAGQQL